MLTVKIPPHFEELYDEEHNLFVKKLSFNGYTFVIEHSLVSISKWEQKMHIPYLDDRYEHTPEDELFYIKCMTITQNVPDDVYNWLTKENIQEIREYINDPMTASTVRSKKSGRKRILTNELLYCYMFNLNIPMECQKWHLSRLIMLIEVCNAENSPKEKMSQEETIRHYAEINERNKARFNTTG